MLSLNAGVEIGGTKCVVLLARGREIVEQVRLTTSDPMATLTACSDHLARMAARHGAFAALGIGSFGPLGLDPARAGAGCITNTPKLGWPGTDLLAHFARHGVPMGLDTDVAGAALAEGRWGAAVGAQVHVYLTIGTGIGAGIVVGGRPVHGLVHPEVGHIRVRRTAGDSFAGSCPVHGDCLEGLASGPAIAARSGRPGNRLDAGDPVWDLVANELAELMMTLVLTLSPARIVVGGGVADGQPHLLDRVRVRTRDLLAGYVPNYAIDGVIVPPALGADAGPLGTIAIAELALAAGS